MSESIYQMYGIKNCDTVRKARNWLEQQGIRYHFHDYRLDGLQPDFLQQCVTHTGWQPLLNTRGTTWRKLDESLRAEINDAATAIALMLDHPAMIKRPLLVCGERYLLGFSIESYQQFTAGGA